MVFKKHIRQRAQAGFALLMSLIVVGVLISIGLSVLELSIKQVQLSTNARESEVAFHAANAGMECSRYWRRASATEMENGTGITPVCFGVGAGANTLSELIIDVTGDGQVFAYDYDFTWGDSGDRCTEITTLVASSSFPGAGVTTTNMTTQVPGYRDGNDWYCEPGARCTVISVRGYNKPCSGITNFGTVQREVLLQF